MTTNNYVINGVRYDVESLEAHMAYMNEEVRDPQTWGTTKRFMLSYEDADWMHQAEAIMAQLWDQK